MPVNIGVLQGLIRLRDEFTAGLKKTVEELEKSQKKVAATGKKFEDIGSSLTKSVTLPILGLGAAVVKVASDFESSFAGIRKTVSDATDEFGNLTARGEELSAGMRKLSREIPVNVNELNKIGEAAGQLGIKSENILTFTRTMADLGVTTNLSSGDAATALARLANITKLPQTEFARLGSTIVAMGNNFATTEAEIVQMGLRIAGAGSQIGLTEGQILAFATALSSVGIEAEAGGSAISKVMVNIALAVAKGGKELDNFARVSGLSIAEFKRLFEQDAAGAINAFITGLGNAGEQSLVILDAMGISEVRMRDALLRAAGAGDILTRALKLQSTAWTENTALSKEAEQRYKTFESQLTIFWNRIKDIGITLGTSLLPILQDTANAIEPLIRKTADLAAGFAEAPKWARIVTVAFAGIVASVGPVLFMFGKLLQTWATIITMAPRVAAAIRMVWAALIGPIGVAVAVIATVGVAIDRAINKFRELADEAIALDVRLANLEGSANRFQRTIQKTGGRVSKSILTQAQEDARQLSAELDAAKKRFDDLANTLPKGLAAKVKASPSTLDSFGVRTTFGVDQNTIKSLRDERDEIERLTLAHKKQEKALRSVKSVLPDVTSNLDGLTDSLTKNSSGIDLTSEATEQLLSQYRQLRQSAALQFKQQGEIATLLRAIPYDEQESALKRLEIAHRTQARVLELESQFAELGAEKAHALAIALANQEKKALDASLANDEYTRFLAALADTVQIAADITENELNKSLERSKAKFDEASKPLIRFVQELNKLREDVEFELRIAGIDESDSRLREIEARYLEFLRTVGDGSIAEGERVIEEWAHKLGKSVEDIKNQIGTILDAQAAEQFRGASATSSDIFHAQRASIRRLMETINKETGETFISIADGAAAMRALTQEHISQQLSAWGNFFGILADEFGGLFNYVDSLIRSIQQAQAAGQSLTGALGGLGMSSGTSSAIGSFATVLLIWKAIYDMGMDLIKKSKSKQFGQAGTVTTLDGDFRTGQSAGVGQVSTEAIKAIQDVIRAFEESLRISIDDLAEIGIKLRNDGKKIKAYVAGVFVGEFNDVMEAIQFALAKALTAGLATFSDIPALLQEGIDSLFRGKSLDEIMEFLGALREIVDLGLTPAAIAAREFTNHLDSLWDTLEKIGKLTPAVQEGFDNLLSSEARMWQDLFDSITGRQKTAAEIRADKERELAIAKAELALRKSGIVLRKLEIEAMIAAIKAGRTLIGGTAGGGTSPGATGAGGVLGVAKAFSTAGQAMAATGQAVLQTAGAVISASAAMSEGALAMIAALEAELAALSELQKLLDNLIIPDIGDIKIPGGRGGDRQGVRDFIDDKIFELALRGLTDYQRAIAELTRQYDDLLAQAGKDIKLRDELLKLKEKELALLAKEAKESLVSRFQDFLGLVTPFDQIRQTAEGLIEDIKNSPFGDERKAQMIGRILEDLERQIERLAQEAALGLFGEMLSDLEAIGADELLLAEIRRNMAILEHTLKMAHYRAEIEILKAQGKLSAETLALLDKALSTLEGFNPATGNATPPTMPGEMGVPSDKIVVLNGNRWKWNGTQWLNLGPVPGQEPGTTPKFKDWWATPTDAANKLAEAFKRARDLLSKYQTDAMDPLRRRLKEIVTDFDEIRKVLGDTEEVMLAYSNAVNKALDEFKEPIRQVQRDLFFGENSPFDVLTQWDQVKSDFLAAQTRFKAGDLSGIGDVPSLVQQLLGLARQVTPIGSQQFKDIFKTANEFLNEILALTPDDIGTLTNPMNVAGVSDLAMLSESQLDALSRIRDTSDRTAAAMEAVRDMLYFNNSSFSNVA